MQAGLRLQMRVGVRERGRGRVSGQRQRQRGAGLLGMKGGGEVEGVVAAMCHATPLQRMLRVAEVVCARELRVERLQAQ
jgi:hypothetical protein